jgi:hypothetical protein
MDSVNTVALCKCCNLVHKPRVSLAAVLRVDVTNTLCFIVLLSTLFISMLQQTTHVALV